MSIKTDLRVERTNKFIREAFVRLIDEKGFEAITIGNIAEEAMINRSTFYLHYADKYDLLEKLVENAINRILQEVAPKPHIVDGKLEFEAFVSNIDCIFRIIENDALLYRIILNDDKLVNMRRRCEDALKRKLRHSFSGELLMDRDLFLELMTSIYLTAIKWWLNNDRIFSARHMAKQLASLFEAGPCRVMIK